MNRTIFKKIFINNLLFLGAEIFFLLLTSIGVFDFLQAANTGAMFSFDANFFFVFHLFILVVLSIIAYKRYDEKITFANLAKYYFFSFISLMVMLSILLSMLPAFSPIFVILVTSIFFGLISIFISFIIINFKKRGSLKRGGQKLKKST